MQSRVSFYFIVGILMLTGIALCWHRYYYYNIPFSSDKKSQIWEVEAKIEFTGIDYSEEKDDDIIDSSIKVSLAKPFNQKNFTVIGERYSAGEYGVSDVKNGDFERIEWTQRSVGGNQVLYYTTQFLYDKNAKYKVNVPDNIIDKPLINDAQIVASQAMVSLAHRRSADVVSFTREIIKQFYDEENSNAIVFTEYTDKVDSIVDVLLLEGINAKRIEGLNLEDGRRRQRTEPMIQVYNDGDWQLFNPQTGEQGYPDNFIIWNESREALLEVEGGENSEVTFSFVSNNLSPSIASRKKVDANNLLNFSIHSLPIEEQSVFKTIMLIPIGALIVVFLRILIGLKTSGTFMPVLIALAFVQTELVTGIIGFLLIVGFGLIIRSYLSRLNLLLVARISAVIISVVLIIALFTIIAFNIGLIEGLTITLFPMIILSWTIERMSILWEEEGPKEVFIQGGGSLLTALLVYMAMTNEFIQHVTFNFIGVQLIVLSLILILGNYTGYRLSELYRFKDFAQKDL